MAPATVALLGPKGTYTHLVARERFGNDATLLPMRTISAVFDHLKESPEDLGVVPIENSSGGSIDATIDGLIDRSTGAHIEEELSLNVKLALLGHKNSDVNVLYSHFAPLKHCETWLNEHLPDVERKAVDSTAEAAALTTSDPHAAALAAKGSAELYGLDLLAYPVEPDVKNVTTFVLLSRNPGNAPNASKTSLVVSLPNTSGALCDFLAPFKEHEVNLTRLVSRPVPGQPSVYRFFVDIAGTDKNEGVASALVAAKTCTDRLDLVGVYPVLERYES